jgi:hypothetical protein
VVSNGLNSRSSFRSLTRGRNCRREDRAAILEDDLTLLRTNQIVDVSVSTLSTDATLLLSSLTRLTDSRPGYKFRPEGFRGREGLLDQISTVQHGTQLSLSIVTFLVACRSKCWPAS